MCTMAFASLRLTDGDDIWHLAGDDVGRDAHLPGARNHLRVQSIDVDAGLICREIGSPLEMAEARRSAAASLHSLPAITATTRKTWPSIVCLYGIVEAYPLSRRTKDGDLISLNERSTARFSGSRR